MSGYNQQPDVNQTIKDLKARLQRLEHVPAGTFTGDLIGTASSSRVGCLLCDGSAVSRATYAALFAAISTTYGAGDGSTTFNVPDLRGRMPIGAGTGTAAGATAHALGTTPTSGAGGEETHALSTAEMPSHSHANAGGTNFFEGASNSAAASGAGVGAVQSIHPNTASAGSGSAHNIMQPVTVVNWFIVT